MGILYQGVKRLDYNYYDVTISFITRQGVPFLYELDIYNGRHIMEAGKAYSLEKYFYKAYRTKTGVLNALQNFNPDKLKRRFEYGSWTETKGFKDYLNQTRYRITKKYDYNVK